MPVPSHPRRGLQMASGHTLSTGVLPRGVEPPEPARGIRCAVAPDEHRATFGGEDPFAAPVENRRQDRRLRGRLVAPVTVWTAGAAGRHTGLTISSVLIAEGEPPRVLGLVDPLSELLEATRDTGTFVVHILAESERRLAATFAGQYPGPLFDGIEVTDTPYGPRLVGARAVASCRLEAATGLGYHELVVGVVEEIDLPPQVPPLVRYRGDYRLLA